MTTIIEKNKNESGEHIEGSYKLKSQVISEQEELVNINEVDQKIAMHQAKIAELQAIKNAVSKMDKEKKDSVELTQ